MKKPMQDETGTKTQFYASVAAKISCAAVGVFAGSLLADLLYGDGIQGDDLVQALTFAAIAASAQYALWRHDQS